MNKDDFEGSNVVKDCDGNSQKEKKKLKNSPEMSGKNDIGEVSKSGIDRTSESHPLPFKLGIFFSSAKTTSDS